MDIIKEIHFCGIVGSQMFEKYQIIVVILKGKWIIREIKENY